MGTHSYEWVGDEPLKECPDGSKISTEMSSVNALIVP